MLARCAYPPFVLWIKRTLCLCEDNTLTSHTPLTGSAPLLCLRAPGEPNTARISSVCTCVCVCVFQEAVIKPVSPDVLYLFRVQAVCLNDKRSDFSQSMLFRGKCAHTHTHVHVCALTLYLFVTSMCLLCHFSKYHQNIRRDEDRENRNGRSISVQQVAAVSPCLLHSHTHTRWWIYSFPTRSLRSN